MYLCMCTPDLYFTSTEVLIRLQNKSTKIHRAKEQLLFSSTNTCSGGLHGWEGHRHWATLTSSEHFSSKGNTGSRVNPQRVLCKAQNIDRAWLFHPALHTCPWGAFLLGFWSTICLLLFLVTSDAVKRKPGGFSVLLFSSCLQERHFRICLLKVALAEETGRWEQAAGTPDGHTQFLPHFCDSVCNSQLRLHLSPESPTWRWLRHPWC